MNRSATPAVEGQVNIMDEQMGVYASEGPEDVENPATNQITDTPEELEYDADDTESGKPEAYIAMRRKIAELERQLKASDADRNLVDESGKRSLSNDTSYGKPQGQKRAPGGVDRKVEDLEAWIEFPNLKPGETQDKVLAQLVEDRYLAERARGNAKTKVEVAREISREFSGKLSVDATAVASQARTTLAQKEAANQESRGTSVRPNAVSREDENAIRRRINEGDIDALGKHVSEAVLSQEELERLGL